MMAQDGNPLHEEIPGTWSVLISLEQIHFNGKHIVYMEHRKEKQIP